MKRYHKTLALVAIVAGVGAVLFLRPRAGPVRPKTRATARRSLRIPDPVAAVAPTAAPGPGPRAVAAPGDFGVMTKDVALAIATSPALQLSRAEASALEHEYKILTYERMLLEQKLASAEQAPTGETLIHVPEYKAEGDALYRAFTTAVSDVLGTDRAREFIRLNRRDVMVQNNELGRHAQTILVQLNPDDGVYHIVHRTELSAGTLGIESSAAVPRLSISDLRADNLSVYTYLQPLLSK